MTMRYDDFCDLNFAIQPADQGQIVTVSYALWGEAGLVIRHTTDRSDRTDSYDAAEAGERFEPWNGVVEIVGEYIPLVIR